MKTHTVKSNAKRVARKLCEQFPILQVCDPSQDPDGTWLPVVTLAEDVSTDSVDVAGPVPAAVLEVALFQPPKGWVMKAGGELARKAPRAVHEIAGADVVRDGVVVTVMADPKVDAILGALKPGSKKLKVMQMLRTYPGVTAAQVGEAMGWQEHTARAFISVQTRDLGLTLMSAKPEAGGKSVYSIVGAL